MNRVFLVGYIGRDPETKYTASGQAVASFSVATDESYKGHNGERQKRTSFEIVANNFLALDRARNEDGKHEEAPSNGSTRPEISDEDMPF